MKILLPLLALLVATASGQEISQYMEPVPLGNAMMTPREKEDFQWKRESEAMQKIQRLNLYAVFSREFAGPVEASDGSGQITDFESGEAYPFLGRIDGATRIRLGKFFVEVPNGVVTISAATPVLERIYSLTMKQYAANEAANAQAQAAQPAQPQRPT